MVSPLTPENILTSDPLYRHERDFVPSDLQSQSDLDSSVESANKLPPTAAEFTVYYMIFMDII